MTTSTDVGWTRSTRAGAVDRSGATIRLLVGLTLPFLALSACSAPETDVVVRPTVAATDVPDFTGIYADDFARWYLWAETDEARAMIADEVITDEELVETLSIFRSCLEAKGVTLTERRFDGSITFSFDQNDGSAKANEVTTRCGESTGYDSVSTLHRRTHRNPERLDENQIVVDCLIDRKLVPADYTVADLEAHSVDDPPSITTPAAYEEYQQCRTDPLGLDPAR